MPGQEYRPSEWIDVRVSDHWFGVLDAGDVPVESGDWSNGLVVKMSHGAMIYTGISHGYVRVAVEVLESSPEYLDISDWDEVIDSSVYSASGELRVDSPDTGAATGLAVLSSNGPGHYRIRVHARGRDTNYDAVQNDPVEDYVLLAWPAAAGVDVLHKISDKCGADLRASVG